jgi:polyisoprenoid-binding protein YceI
MKIQSLLLSSCLVLIAQTLLATSQSFDFKDPKGVNHVMFMLDAPLEFISGSGKNISGIVDFDKASPAKTKGEIIITVDSLSVTSKKMTNVMMGKKWLNAKLNPQISFKFDSIDVSQEVEGTVIGDAKGTLTLMGVSQEVSAPVKITLAEGAAGKRSNKKDDKRDLLVVRSNFGIQLDSFGLKMNAATKLKVSNDVDVKVVIAGYGQN